MNQDRKFVDFIVMERMNELYDDWKGRPITDMEKVKKVEQGYHEAVDALSDEHRNAIETYFNQVTSDMSAETEFFYNSGVRDGYKLCQYIEKMLSKSM